MLALVNGGTIPDRGTLWRAPRARTARGWASSTRRWSTRPCRATCSPLGASTLAGRAHHPRPGDRVARARRAGQAAVLARRRSRPADRARPRHRRVHARARSRDSTRTRPRPRRGCASATGSTTLAADNLIAYVTEQREATGALPTDRAITIERFRDELGDWRVCILSPVRRAGARAVGAGARGAAVGSQPASRSQTLWSDDGIVLRFADGDELPDADALCPIPTRSRSCLLDPARRLGAVRRPVSRERRARAADAAASPRPAHAAVGRSGSSRSSCSPWRASTRRSRSSSRPTGRACRTCSTCRR